MNTKTKLFLDSSAFISALLSSKTGSPMARILALGEAGILDLRISREVIGDVERFVRNRNAGQLPRIAALIAGARIATTLAPSDETTDFCDRLIGYRPDARILAAAIESASDILVTLDSTHLLGNPKIKPPEVAVMVMNPHDGLSWCFEQWKGSR